MPYLPNHYRCPRCGCHIFAHVMYSEECDSILDALRRVILDAIGDEEGVPREEEAPTE